MELHFRHHIFQKIFLFFVILFETHFCDELSDKSFAANFNYDIVYDCNDNRFSYLRPFHSAEAGYLWKGIIRVDLADYLKSPQVVLALNGPAERVVVDEKDGRSVYSDSEGRFNLKFPNYGVDKFTGTLQFTVHTIPEQGYPYIGSLKLNGVEICPNPKAIDPPSKVTRIELERRRTTPAPQASCGRRIIKHQGYVTNGYPSQAGDWPWHAAIFHIIRTTTDYKCGGTLVTPRTIVTASHCVTDNGQFLIPDRILVKLGLHYLLFDNSNTQHMRVFKVIPHNEFSFTNFRNDIAILTLLSDVTFTPYVQPACLWPKNNTNIQHVHGKNGMVVGWGLTERNELAEVLTQGEMPIVPHLTCLDSDRDFFGRYVASNNFCAGYRNGTSVCNGDSGGGLFLHQDDGLFYLRGIVSLSTQKEDSDKAICNPKNFVIFTDVAFYLEWIDNNKV